MKRKYFPRMPEWVAEKMHERMLEDGVDFGDPFDKVDFHHAILPKSAVMGLPDCEKEKIHNPCNILLIAHSYHLNRPVPTGVEAARVLYAIYGKPAVQAWYDSINWTNGQPFELPED
jgi:hypothetical protein